MNSPSRQSSHLRDDRAQLAVVLPRQLLSRLADLSFRNGITRTALIESALARELRDADDDDSHISVELPPETSAKLHAFRRAYYDPPVEKVVTSAIDRLIDDTTRDRISLDENSFHLSPGYVVRGCVRTYQVVRSLGHGGVGTVYVVRHGDDLFAMKVLGGQRFKITAQLRERFARETAILSKVEHANVIRVLDAPTVNGAPAIVMELAEGGSLYQTLQRIRRVPLPTAVGWIEQILSGVSAIHKRGIVHRDLTPKNILFRKDGSVAIADFGIARSVDDATLTGSHDVMGSLLYISSQQREKPHTAARRDDVYSLGQIFFHVVTGLIPHGGVRSPRSHRRDCPMWLNAFIERLRQYERTARPVSAVAALRIFTTMRRQSATA